MIATDEHAASDGLRPFGRTWRRQCRRLTCLATVVGICLAAPAAPQTGAATYADTVSATPGLIGYWRLGDAATPTAADVKATNPGTYTGGATLGIPGAISGDTNTAAAFDGSTGWVSVASSDSLNVGDSFSVEGWVKRRVVGTTTSQVVVSKQNGSWVLMFNASDRLVLRRSNVADVAASTIALTDVSAWHHVAATKNGPSVRLYIDGQDVTGAVTDRTMVDNTSSLAIGQSASGAFFQGAIDDVALYSGALTPATITQHYQLPTATAPGDPVIAAAGDISCSAWDARYNGGTGTPVACQQSATSNLLVNAGLTAVLPLGDLQYNGGQLTEFQSAFDPTWGRVKSLLRPAVGNHEYVTPAAAGYFDYFNGVGAATGPAGDRGKGYYSFDVGEWHLIALNSECSEVGGCGVGSAQEQWLKADLATHPSTCTLAYWHRPLFNSSFTGPAAEMGPIWQDLYDAGADVVLNGHAHAYERFAPQAPTGALDAARGIREFVSGAGGEDHHSISSAIANSEVNNSDTFGVLRLTLHATGYDWRFVPVTAGAFTDSGSGACH